VIRAFYGPKWAPAIPIFTVLAFYGLVRAIGATSDVVFMATGNPVLVKRMRTIQLAIGASLVYPVAKTFGVVGVAVLFTCAHFIGTIYGLGRVQHILGIGKLEWLDTLRRPAIAAGITYLLSRLTVELAVKPPWAAAVLVFAVLTGSYAASVFLLDRGTFGELRAVLVRPKGVGTL